MWLARVVSLLTPVEFQPMGAGADRVQFATDPQSPLSGPVRCCDVTDLYQAFSQRTSPGRLWISLDSGLLFVLVWAGRKRLNQKQKPQHFPRATNLKENRPTHKKADTTLNDGQPLVQVPDPLPPPRPTPATTTLIPPTIVPLMLQKMATPPPSNDAPAQVKSIP